MKGATLADPLNVLYVNLCTLGPACHCVCLDSPTHCHTYFLVSGYIHETSLELLCWSCMNVK